MRIEVRLQQHVAVETFGAKFTVEGKLPGVFVHVQQQASSSLHYFATESADVTLFSSSLCCEKI